MIDSKQITNKNDNEIFSKYNLRSNVMLIYLMYIIIIKENKS